jgi:flagellar M-ring protein FliF
MSTTVAEIDAQPVRQNALAEGFARMDGRRRSSSVWGQWPCWPLRWPFFMGRQADWRVLYANLSDKDGGAIVAQLSQMNVPYKHADGGGPSWCRPTRCTTRGCAWLHRACPKGSVTGFELMENNRFGMTQFQERLTFQRGLEGRADALDPVALVGAGGARAPGAAQPERLLPRTAEAVSASVLLTCTRAARWTARRWPASCTWWPAACPR